jgi:hypothetical protein
VKPHVCCLSEDVSICSTGLIVARLDKLDVWRDFVTDVH